MFLTLFKTGGGKLKYCYIHDLQRSLFNLHNLTIISGTVNNRSRQKEYSFDSIMERDKKIRVVFDKHIKDGYQLIYSYPKELNIKQVIKAG